MRSMKKTSKRVVLRPQGMLLVALSASLLTAACNSQGGVAVVPGAGGQTSSSAPGSGGGSSPASGGVGGTSTTSAGTGGATATGGAGGATSTGGITSTGGPPSSGGNPGTGGSASATGGNSATGGSTSGTGGATTGSGGTTSGTGGTTSGTGGTTSGTGGARATGGTASGTGGSTSGTGGSTSGTGGSGLLVPANGALLGVFTPAQSQSEVATKETQVGRKFAIHLGYFDWSIDYTSFAKADIAAGRIPYVTVEPWNVTLDAISSGAQDATINTRATAVKSLTGKVMLRFAHEMNGNWYPWDGVHNGNDATAPPKYVAAFRHIKDVFDTAGVTNVLWVFCPNANSVPSATWNTWQSFYPGDTYVDWMCFDGYDWGGGTFSALTSTIYTQFVAKNNKPIMLGETSTPLLEKAAWIGGIIPAMKSQFPLLKALVWFDVNIGAANNYLYDSSSASLSAFVTMANDPYFNP